MFLPLSEVFQQDSCRPDQQKPDHTEASLLPYHPSIILSWCKLMPYDALRKILPRRVLGTNSICSIETMSQPGRNHSNGPELQNDQQVSPSLTCSIDANIWNRSGNSNIRILKGCLSSVAGNSIGMLFPAHCTLISDRHGGVQRGALGMLQHHRRNTIDHHMPAIMVGQNDLPAVQHTEFNLTQMKITSPFFGLKNTMGQTSSRPTGVKAATQGVSKLNLHNERRSTPSHKRASTGRRERLAQTAAETKSLLPNILATTPHAPAHGHLYSPSNLHPLSPQKCPNLPKTPIRVLNSDTIDAALSLSTSTSTSSGKPVLILNMANAYHSGGGWLSGALAQEEALCYRSSLSFTLKTRYYPLPEAGGIYSPTVVVIRESMSDGHGLLDLSKPDQLPIVSCVSVAGISGPKVTKNGKGEEVYKDFKDRDIMKEKMRVVLRIAAVNKHRVLVLGALGCGAFGNPRGEVMQCWKEVFGENEFDGGWWEAVVFAVMEPGEGKDGNGNFGVFYRELDGVKV